MTVSVRCGEHVSQERTQATRWRKRRKGGGGRDTNTTERLFLLKCHTFFPVSFSRFVRLHFFDHFFWVLCTARIDAHMHGLPSITTNVYLVWLYTSLVHMRSFLWVCPTSRMIIAASLSSVSVTFLLYQPLSLALYLRCPLCLNAPRAVFLRSTLFLHCRGVMPIFPHCSPVCSCFPNCLFFALGVSSLSILSHAY